MVKKLTGILKEIYRQVLSDKPNLGSYEKLYDSYATNGRLRGASHILQNRDIPRLGLVDFTGKNFDDLRAELMTEEIQDHHYMQGLFDGGLSEDIIEFYKTILLNNLDNLDEMETWCSKSNRNALRFVYRDDTQPEGKLRSFGLSYNKQPGEQANWVLEIGANPTDDLDEREYVIFTNGNKLIPTGTEINDFSQELQNALHCQILAEKLKPLFDSQGNIQPERVEQLSQSENFVQSNSSVTELTRTCEFNKLVEQLSSPFPFIQTVTGYFIDRKDSKDTFDDKNYPAIKKFLEALLALHKKLTKDAYDPTLIEHGKKILASVAETFRKVPGPTPNELYKLSVTFNRVSTALEHPENLANLKFLYDDASKLQGKPSRTSKALGASLLLFTAAALVVAGLLGAIPTGGLSLVAVAAGAALLVGAGGAFFKKGMESGVCKSVRFFAKQREVFTQDTFDSSVQPNYDECKNTGF